MRALSKLVECVDEIIKNSFALEVGLDLDEEPEGAVMQEDGEGLFSELGDAFLENLGGEVVLAIATVATVFESGNGFPATRDVRFGDVENDSGFNLVTGGLGAVEDGILFAKPAPDRGEDEREGLQILAVEIGEYPIIEKVGFD